jgi:hypothetical protein
VLEITMPSLRQLYDDWDARRRGREFPSRADFDPVELTYVIGKMSLLDVLYDPLRFRYRVHATQTADRLGFDLTGKSLEMWPDAAYRATVHEVFVEVVENRQPGILRRERQLGDGRIWRYEVLTLPLSADGLTIDMLISALEFA